MQSEMLTKFYQQYNEWLERGAPDFRPFRRDCGLCWNVGEIQGANYLELSRELVTQFSEQGLDITTPFNNSDKPYSEESKFETCHTNAKRIQWVKDHINLGEAK